MFHLRKENIKLAPDAEAVIATMTKIDVDLTKDKILNQKLMSLVKRLSFDACDLFLEGLIQTPAPLRMAYLNAWGNFSEKLTDKYKTEFSQIHQIFFKEYPWSYLNNPSFFQLIDILIQPEMSRLWLWFVSYFDPKLSISIQQVVLDENIQLFKKFVDCCLKFKIHNQMAEPASQNVLSFHLQGRPYIQRCIDALDKSTQKAVQAKLLHLLPPVNLMQDAFLKKSPFICLSMIYNNTFSIPSLPELALIFDYSNYKARSLSYLAVNGRIDFLDSLKFYNELDEVKSTKLDSQEKLLLSRMFVQYATQQISSVSISGLIYWAIKIKEELGEGCFVKLFEFPFQPGSDLNQYIYVCQLLIELVDVIDVEIILKEHSGKLTELIRILQVKQNDYLLKKYPEKNLDDVLSDFQKQSEFVCWPLSTPEIKQLKDDYIAINALGKNLVAIDLKKLTEDARACANDLKNVQLNPTNKHKMIAIIREIMRRELKFYPYNTQVLSLLSLINSPQNLKGRIGQIRTGEGKSMIVAMLSAYMGLQNKAVDVITSSRYLAIRDHNKYQGFYAALDITSSHICYDYPEKRNFDGLVLYATNYDAEFSVLRDVFFQQDKRYTTINGKLVARPFDVAIVDEVDNLFIDAALNSARLAIPSAEYTAWVYEPILKFVQAGGETAKIDMDSAKLLRLTLVNYQAGKFKKLVDTFTDEQILIWIRSAYRAQFKLKMGKDYIIQDSIKDTSGEDSQKSKVIIVDSENTGRLMTASRWSNGVHELLEVKNGVQPKNESTTLASVSHPSFFEYYKNIYGLTGTLGELQEREEITKIYKIDTFDVPPHFPSQRKKNIPECLGTLDAYFLALFNSIQASVKLRQPVLVLFASIAESLAFSDYLRKKSIKHQVLNEAQQEQEDYIIDRAGAPGAITIATNIAGRGADIILTSESKKVGGLHLILAFYPANTRVEDQGYGRAGRQGQPGSCSMILYCEDEQIKKLIPAQSDRIKLCSDQKFVDKLNGFRTLYNKVQSLIRIEECSKEFIHYAVLKQYGEIYTDFVKKISAIRLDLIADALDKIKILKPDMTVAVSMYQNPELEQLQVRTQALLNQQVSGVVVNWLIMFLPRAVENYLLWIQQRWAKYFSSLDNQRTSEVGDGVAYRNAAQSRFFEFINSSMRQEFENPLSGFINFCQQILKIDIRNGLANEILNSKSSFFATWVEKNAPKNNIGTAKVGMFSPLVISAVGNDVAADKKTSTNVIKS
jgi:preprotein translocase subunit SecA